ncbi:indole-3-acetic acid-induced protein ARG2-like [Juglans microcarpa x Juglans regia]|uniref:indole-3-acetic acid-induced protein ARG2-like n=1 Tax=Juglans microcarpa x Juglans regia TaxID=2249226 RepID=UPI001B7E4F32|nr:indole-3-acetic acid-induced protein ARG2-like [Juglans microcarpa x Juglans regia]
MARSLSNAKFFSSLLVDGFSNALSRRGYAASSQGIMATVARGGGGSSGARIVKKAGEDAAAAGSTEKVAWVPDPVTGYYRPENCMDEVDVAELRALLLKSKH